MSDIDTQSARLHGDITQSKFHRLLESGHMIHQTATNQVMNAIEEATGEAISGRLGKQDTPAFEVAT